MLPTVPITEDPRPLHQCPDCGVYYSNDHHQCVEYEPAHPCPECGAPSVYVYIAAPGTGSGWSLRNGRFDASGVS